MKEMQQVPQACETCTEYIKRMKSLEFKLTDVMRERDLK